MTEPGGQDAFRVIAVVVAYRPDAEVFSRLISALASQVHSTIVLDNGDGFGTSHLPPDGPLQRIDMGGNAGVAAAHNAGFCRARELGASHVLLLDHDSVPALDMTRRLLDATIRLGAQGHRVAAVGAEYGDRRHDPVSPFVVMRGLGYRRVSLEAGSNAVAVSFLISAGSLIGLSAYEDVGPMEEKLFIDYVDIEWCLRASLRGWRCFGIPGARMEHLLGDDLLRWREGGRPVRLGVRTLSSRSPERHYFLFRNGCWLLVHGRMPWRWKVAESTRLLACFAAFALFAATPRLQIASMVRGVVDGLRGRMGPSRSARSMAPLRTQR